MVTYPNGWKEEPLANIVLFKNGQAHENDISTNGKYIVVNSKFISTNGAVKKRSSRRNQPANNSDILMVMSDLPNGKALGKCYYVEEDNVYTVNQRICVLSNAKINSKLLYYLTNRNPYFLDFDNGVTQTNLRRKEVLNCIIKYPQCSNEQDAIASTLTDFSEYIDNLTELIQKKKAIRDGALEDLVSGKTRLDGFEGVWKSELLQKICDVYDGTHQTPKYSVSGVKFVSVENVFDIYSSDKYITQADYNRDFKIRPEKGDVLMTRIGDVGTSCLVETNEPIAYYVSLALFKNIRISSTFLNHYIKSKGFQNELDNRTLHHATPKKINKGDIGKCKVFYPIDSKEQDAIAEVLTAMDEEIKSLEVEKEKMIQIKEGAMDDLLTGRVRLKI